NRLYQFETSPSNSASLADHRVALKPSDVAALAAALAAALGVQAPNATRPAAVSNELFDALVADLKANQGTSVVIAGEDQPPVVHALAHAMNKALGNVGKTVNYLQPAAARPAVHRDELTALVAGMNDGTVKALVVLKPGYRGSTSE
ncbi:MAG TPA: molybdopterin oxidoreductase, partial [Trueperaceae bacterium]|nr:molybdopterin oxidoreductase [Trueperaceae bacterium]